MWKASGRLTSGERDGNRQRKPFAEEGEMLLLHLEGVGAVGSRTNMPLPSRKVVLRMAL